VNQLWFYAMITDEDQSFFAALPADIKKDKK
jgi:hypothetical protein